MITTDRFKPFVGFVRARHMVWVARSKGLPKPWTKDPILQSYRFCNVYRELDTVTQWIRQNWSPKLGKSPELWFWMVIARLVNHPPTLALIPVRNGGYDWHPDDFVDAVEHQIANGQKAFGGAYMIASTAQPKHLHIVENILTPLYDRMHYFRPVMPDTLAAFHSRLVEQPWLGSFLAAQVVADVKNTPGRFSLAEAPDWWTWCAPGPGSMRGLSRVLHEDAQHRFSPSTFVWHVNELQKHVNAMAAKHGWPMLCAQDVQNCLCEFDKYERVRLGEGKPRQKYAGTV